MKLSTAIYLGAFAVLAVADVIVNVIAGPEKAHQDQIAAYAETVSTAVETAGSPPHTKEYQTRGWSQVSIRPGFRFVNDAAAGNTIYVSGPTSALEELYHSRRGGVLTFDFRRPVRLKEPVEVRLNMAGFTPGSLTISFQRAAPGRTDLAPDLVTTTPLTPSVLTLNGIPPHPIEVMADRTVVYGTENLTRLRGSTRVIEVVKPVNQSAEFVQFSGLTYDEKVVTETD